MHSLPPPDIDVYNAEDTIPVKETMTYHIRCAMVHYKKYKCVL